MCAKVIMRYVKFPRHTLTLCLQLLLALGVWPKYVVNMFVCSSFPSPYCNSSIQKEMQKYFQAALNIAFMCCYYLKLHEAAITLVL